MGIERSNPEDGGHGATAFAAKVRLAHDTTTGERYLRSSWALEYLRRCGWRESAERAAGILEAVGLERPNPRSEGQVRARDRAAGETVRLRFWIVPAELLERWTA